MNKEFTYLDNRVMVQSEDSNYNFQEYQDNIEEVLSQEKLIETMENEKWRLRDERSRIKSSRVHPLKGALISGGTVLLTGAISSGILQFAFQSSATASNLMIVVAIATSIMSVASGVIMHQLNKKDDKRIQGIDSQVKFLCKSIETERKRLRKLKKQKTTNKEIERFKTILLPKEEELLEQISPKLGLMDDIGRNGKKYYKYHKEGRLEEKLEGIYNEDEIEKVKDYIKEQGPRLVKRISCKR